MLLGHRFVEAQAEAEHPVGAGLFPARRDLARQRRLVAFGGEDAARSARPSAAWSRPAHGGTSPCCARSARGRRPWGGSQRSSRKSPRWVVDGRRGRSDGQPSLAQDVQNGRRRRRSRVANVVATIGRLIRPGCATIRPTSSSSDHFGSARPLASYSGSLARSRSRARNAHGAQQSLERLPGDGLLHVLDDVRLDAFLADQRRASGGNCRIRGCSRWSRRTWVAPVKKGGLAAPTGLEAGLVTPRARRARFSPWA